MRRQTSPEEEALEELRRLKARAPSGKKKRTPWVRYTAVVLLAVVCIGGAELAACRFFAPALYEELMEPVRETAHQTAQTAGRALEAVCRAGNAAAKKAGEAAAVLALRAGEARAGFREWMEAVAAPPPWCTSTRRTRPGPARNTARTPCPPTAAAPLPWPWRFPL